MAITLEEAAKLSDDILLKGVIETIVKDSPNLQFLPFIEIIGNGLTYNRELTLPGAGWYDVNESWAVPTPPTFEQVTATLKILGENADVDNFLKATRSNVQDRRQSSLNSPPRPSGTSLRTPSSPAWVLPAPKTLRASRL